MDAEERERIRREYAKLERIESRERLAEQKKRQQCEMVARMEVEARMSALWDRIVSLGIDHLFRLNCTHLEYIGGVAHPRIDFSMRINYPTGRTPEVVLEELLDRIEKAQPKSEETS